MADAGVADQHIHIPDLAESPGNGFAVCHIAADGRSAGGRGYGLGLFMGLLVEKPDPVTPGGETLHRGFSNATGAAGNYDG
jgi:hypothetical protein